MGTAHPTQVRAFRGGVTLVELLLALSLSIAVLTAVTMAINLYFKMLEVRRTSLEEIQVVRVVTQKMTNDIRMLVPHNEPDLSGLETAMNNAMQAATKQLAAATGTTAISIGGSGGASGVSTGGTGGGGQANQAGGQGNQTGVGQTGGGQTGGAQGQGSGGGNQAGQANSASKTGSTGASGTGAQGGASSTSGSGGSGSSTSGTTATTEEAAAPPVVQLVGTATELRFDISRLPRVDQYKGIMTQGGEFAATDLPSDVKTIVYFIRSESSAQTYVDDPRALGGEASTDGYGRGLMRAEMDRAVTVYSDGDSSGALAYSRAQLLANEVVGLGFEYFDGTEWLTEWDSATSSSLPRAIRVWLSVQPTYGMSEQELADSNKGKEVPATDFYFVISVPTSPLVASTATETTEATETGTSSSTTTSSSSSTTGATP